jgi:hypothetical protein
MVDLKGVGVGLVSILMALGFIAGSGYAFFDYYQQTSNAQSVDATVLSSEVVQTYDADQNRVYRPSITYEYTFNGETHTSESIYTDDNVISSRSRANEIVSEYSPGSEVTAYVSPDHPDTAYLIQEGIPWRYFIFPVIGLFVLPLAASKTWKSLRGANHPS